MSLLGGGRRCKRPARGSPLLLSHDIDDSQPPNVSYASTHSLSSNSDDEDEEEEVGGACTPDDPMVMSQNMDWEHLDPSIEELRMFEEEQMRQALSSAKSFPSTSSDQNRAACVHAQETEIYRQRLRRLDYNSTYMDYAALTSIGSGSAGVSLASPGDSFRASGSVAAGSDEGNLEKIGKQNSPEPAAESSETQGTIASGIFGTLSSLWTSTFGGSKS